MADSSVVPDTSVKTTIEKADPSVGTFDDFGFDATALDARGSRRRWLRWVAIPVAVLFIAAAIVWFVNPFGSAATTLVTARATTGTIVSSVSISGSVASSTVTDLNFAASGTVNTVKVAVGDQVTSGQVLATIDDSAVAVQLDTARANLAAAQAKLTTDRTGPTAATKASARDSVRQAQLQLSSARQSLSDTYAQNVQSISQARAAVKSAKATLAADKASLPSGDPQIAKDKAAVSSAESALTAAELKATLAVHQAQNQVNSALLGVTAAQHAYNLKVAPATSAQITADKASVAAATSSLATLEQNGTSIVSTVAGTVTTMNLKVGQSVGGSSSSSSSSSGTSTPQIELMDLAHLQIAGQASETDIPKLKMDQAATITAAALGSDTVVGKVCSLSNVGTQISGVTSFAVTVCLDSANPALLVGMSATAAVVTDRSDNAVLVPSLAVRTVGGQQVVTVLGADGKTQTTVPVTVGITNGSQTEIMSGLASGATVVESLQSTSPTRNGGGGGRFFPGGGFGG